MESTFFFFITFVVLLYFKLKWYRILTCITFIVLMFIKLEYPTSYFDYKGINYIFNYQDKNIPIYLMDWYWLCGIIFTLFIIYYIIKIFIYVVKSIIYY